MNTSCNIFCDIRTLLKMHDLYISKPEITTYDLYTVHDRYELCSRDGGSDRCQVI